ncbi:MAG: glycoside hydrolase family 127 protein [Ruminococcaceae bacterium]|nr:glycoside hydrolase family 127 protein [Oscillospiraceae bacterium]
MKTYSYKEVRLTSGYLLEKQELNRKITIDAVYDRFFETGRISAFDFSYDPTVEGSVKPHYFWDSDVAKWIEGAAYILKHHPEMRELEQKADGIISKIKEHQEDNGYFNIYFTVCEPENRFSNRNAHELYCAGHLMEAAVAYAEATGKETLLECMEKYAEHIYKVFVVDRSAAFFTPGHEEIELALVRMYHYTGERKYLDLAAHFINTRGTVVENDHPEYDQSHKPVREQAEAVGHAVRALYLYTGMAHLAKETDDDELKHACRVLWNDIMSHKMYVTGGVGSTNIGEAFTTNYDLPSDTAYAETCAAIALMFFGNAMLALENDAKYADVIERALYNGVLSGLSLDGTRFFYTNPLEINLSERWSSTWGKRVFPISQRPGVFSCSCCPPNINRLLPSLGNYIYGSENDTLYINQFISSQLNDVGVCCTQKTDYPNDGTVKISARGIARVAVRIPSWCEHLTLNKPYSIERGYAVVENDGGDIVANFDIKPRLVYADSRVMRNAGRVCVARGPVVYCAEGMDNGADLHSYSIPSNPEFHEAYDENLGLYTLQVACVRETDFGDELYSNRAPQKVRASLKLIPYNCFANRGETDMIVWLRRE